MPFDSLTGRGVRVGIIDSGVNPAHPHVGGVAGGVSIGAHGESGVYLDYLGHGTAVAGAIREKSRDAVLYAVKVFDRALSTKAEILLRALEWCLAHDLHVINLSLGTRNEDYYSCFQQVLARAAESGIVVVAPYEADGQPILPGCLPAALGVGLDRDCPRDTYRGALTGSRPIFRAAGYPRPLPGLPPERNLQGISFAVANMTGFVARAREAFPAVPVQPLQQLMLGQGSIA